MQHYSLEFQIKTLSTYLFFKKKYFIIPGPAFDTVSNGGKARTERAQRGLGRASPLGKARTPWRGLAGRILSCHANNFWEPG